MKLKVRYENEYQTIELTTEAAEQLWVSLSLDDECLSEAEKEQRIQEVWEQRFNRPDYNCWHRETRHIDPTPKARKLNGKRGYVGPDDDDVFDVMENLAVTEEQPNEDFRGDEEMLRERIRSAMKPDYAEMLIAIHLDGMKPGEYAAMMGERPNTLNHRLQRAEKKLRELIMKSSL